VILIYVHLWINEDAVKVTLVQCQWDLLNLYKIIKDLLNELAELYNDSDKETNFQREYAHVRIESMLEFNSRFDI